MKINLKRLDKKLHFRGTNESGQTVEFDSAAAGYKPSSPSPMEVVLMSAAACSSIDLILILEKMKQKLEDLEVETEGLRVPEGDVKPFSQIHLHFKLKGNLDLTKVKRAVELSVEKYCSVLEMLKSTAAVSHSFQINEKINGED